MYLSLSIYIYIYIYTHTHTQYVPIYMYIYKHIHMQSTMGELLPLLLTLHLCFINFRFCLLCSKLESVGHCL